MSEMGAETQVKKTIFFDLYGTLIDITTDEHDPFIYSVLSRYLSYHSVKIGPEELKGVYFEEIEQHLRQSKELHPEVDVYKIFHTIMHRYGNKRYSQGIVIDTAVLFRSLTIRQFGLFPSLFETLTHIRKKYRIAIISDAQWVFAEPEMEMLGLDRFFTLRILSSRYGYKKPDVRLFQEAMKKFRVKPEESLYIGDNLQKDLVGAKKAGMRFIFFGQEFRECNALKPDGIFSNYAELGGVISEMP
jgi:putative hydrolase of the HAD superfamily